MSTSLTRAMVLAAALLIASAFVILYAVDNSTEDKTAAEVTSLTDESSPEPESESEETLVSNGEIELRDLGIPLYGVQRLTYDEATDSIWLLNPTTSPEFALVYKYEIETGKIQRFEIPRAEDQQTYYPNWSGGIAATANGDIWFAHTDQVFRKTHDEEQFKLMESGETEAAAPVDPNAPADRAPEVRLVSGIATDGDDLWVIRHGFWRPIKIDGNTGKTTTYGVRSASLIESDTSLEGNQPCSMTPYGDPTGGLPRQIHPLPEGKVLIEFGDQGSTATAGIYDPGTESMRLIRGCWSNSVEVIGDSIYSAAYGTGKAIDRIPLNDEPARELDVFGLTAFVEDSFGPSRFTQDTKNNALWFIGIKGAKSPDGPPGWEWDTDDPNEVEIVFGVGSLDGVLRTIPLPIQKSFHSQTGKGKKELKSCRDCHDAGNPPDLDALQPTFSSALLEPKRFDSFEEIMLPQFTDLAVDKRGDLWFAAPNYGMFGRVLGTTTSGSQN